MRFVPFAAACTLAAVLPAQTNPFATQVVAFDDQGKAGGGIFDPRNALGRPQGFTHVHSLGIAGSLTLGFDGAIADGPGADLIVTENPFFSGPLGHAFSEVMFVEVSTNGRDFARVPSAYYGPAVSPGPFGVVSVGWYAGFGGALPADPTSSDPLDVVLAGGDAIDLAVLRQHPLVVQGLVKLDQITQVRLVDAVDGVAKDGRGVLVRDPGSGSADVDAVTVLHKAGQIDPRGPQAEVAIASDSTFQIRLSDPDGLVDLDPASFHAAFWGLRLPGLDLLGWMTVTQATSTSVELTFGPALPPGFPLHLAVSIRDRAGNRSGAAAVRALN